DKLVSTELVNNFRSMKLDDSLLKKLMKALRVLIELHDDADVVKDALRYIEVDTLFDEINTEALRCKVKAESQTLTPASQEHMVNLVIPKVLGMILPQALLWMMDLVFMEETMI
ncbi:disease resistance protein (CC-NBS-LRR class) family protein, partial [Trifolium medium]|nr:disease resistance protein (CC-NBS-LRR class) family protein [Trifolium medium]